MSDLPEMHIIWSILRHFFQGYFQVPGTFSWIPWMAGIKTDWWFLQIQFRGRFHIPCWGAALSAAPKAGMFLLIANLDLSEVDFWVHARLVWLLQIKKQVVARFDRKFLSFWMRYNFLVINRPVFYVQVISNGEMVEEGCSLFLCFVGSVGHKCIDV